MGVGQGGRGYGEKGGGERGREVGRGREAGREGEGSGEKGGGKRGERGGGKQGERGREAGIEGEGSGERGGGKRVLDTPLSTPTTRLLYILEINLDIVDKYQALTYSKHYGEQVQKTRFNTNHFYLYELLN